MRSVEWCHFQRPCMTHNPDFKVTLLFDAECLRNSTMETKLQWNTNRNLSHALLKGVITNGRDDTKHREASLRRLSFLHAYGADKTVILYAKFRNITTRMHYFVYSLYVQWEHTNYSHILVKRKKLPATVIEFLRIELLTQPH